MKEIFKGKIELVSREDFFAQRNARLEIWKKHFEEFPEMREHTVCTLLDFPETQEMIICDRCNEDIKDKALIRFEDSLVYHRDCVNDELPKKFQRQIKNVVFGNFVGK